MNRGFDTLVGVQFKTVRRAHGWSQREVEDHVGWPPGTLRYVERGKVRLTLEHAAKISSLYDYDLEERLDRAGATPAQSVD